MVGGFAGDNSGGIYDSHAEGEVRGKSYAGGFAGISDGTVKNCYSLGSVTGTDYTGGFAGGISAAENAVGAGLVTVTGTPTYGYTGGFAGRLGGTLAGLDNQITIKNVYGNCMKPDGQWKATRCRSCFPPGCSAVMRSCFRRPDVTCRAWTGPGRSSSICFGNFRRNCPPTRSSPATKIPPAG